MDENITKLQTRAEALFQQNPYAVALWSIDLKIVDVNGAFLELTGYPRDQLLSRGPKDFKVISRIR